MIIHTAHLRHLHMAPRKVRLIVNTVKRLPLSEAEAQLLLQNRRVAMPILKLLRSAAAGAVAKKANRDALMISEIRVDRGPILKRWLPRAQGRATPIHKITSHVTVVLQESTSTLPQRFVFPKKETKKQKEARRQKEKEKVRPAPSEKETKGVRVKETHGPGFFRKVFRRKSV